MPIIDINKFKNQIVFFGFCPGADFSRRLDTRWKELGICEFQYFESKIQVKRFASIEIGDLIVLKKRQIIGKTMRVYGYGLVTGITKDDKGNRVLKVDWSSQEQVIEVPLLGCNATIDIRDIDKVRADMPDAFFEWLKKGSGVAGPLKAVTKEEDNTSVLRFNHSKDKDSVVDQIVDKSLAGAKKTTDFSEIFESEEWQTLKLGFAWSLMGIANANQNADSLKDVVTTYLLALLEGSFDDSDELTEVDTLLAKQIISEIKNEWGQFVDDYFSDSRGFEEGMKEVGQILRKYLVDEQIAKNIIDGYTKSIKFGMENVSNYFGPPSNEEFSFYIDIMCAMNDARDGHTGEPTSYKKLINALNTIKNSDDIKNEEDYQQGLCNYLNYVASYYLTSDRIDEALSHYLEALPVSKELAEKSDRVEIKNDYRSLLDAIAGIYEKQGNVKDAMTYYQLGLDMALEIADKYYLRMTYVKLIQTLARFALFEKSQGNFNGALEKFTQCIPLISEASANFNDDVDEPISKFESFVLSQIDDINKKTNLSADTLSKNQPDTNKKTTNGSLSRFSEEEWQTLMFGFGWVVLGLVESSAWPDGPALEKWREMMVRAKERNADDKYFNELSHELLSDVINQIGFDGFLQKLRADKRSGLEGYVDIVTILHRHAAYPGVAKYLRTLAAMALASGTPNDIAYPFGQILDHLTRNIEGPEAKSDDYFGEDMGRMDRLASGILWVGQLVRDAKGARSRNAVELEFTKAHEIVKFHQAQDDQIEEPFTVASKPAELFIKSFNHLMGESKKSLIDEWEESRSDSYSELGYIAWYLSNYSATYGPMAIRHSVFYLESLMLMAEAAVKGSDTSAGEYEPKGRALLWLKTLVDCFKIVYPLDDGAVSEPEKNKKSANKLTPFGLNPDVETVDINAIPRTDYSDEAATKSREANKTETEVQESESIDEDSTERELLDAAKRGNVDAMELLAEFYKDGKWGNENHVEAYKWYMKAASLGGEYGIINAVSMQLENNNGEIKDLDQGLQYLQKLSNGKTGCSATACRMLGNIYEGQYGNIEGYKQDLDWTIYYYVKAKKINRIDDLDGLERIQEKLEKYISKLDVKYDSNIEPLSEKLRAVGLLIDASFTDRFKKLDETNIYSDILNGDTQFEIAKEYMSKEAEKGRLDSAYHALYWLKIAVVHGSNEAQKYQNKLVASGGRVDDETSFNVGIIYEYGLWDFVKDLNKAKKYYEVAVKNGSKEAVQALERLNSQNNSSEDRNKAENKSKSTKSSVDFRVYENTQNTISKKTNNYVSQPDDPNLLINNMNQFLNQKDYQSCENYLKEQANKGSAVAMYELGLTYTHGTFSNKDYKIALKYYQKAADLNYSKAMHNLAIAYSYGRGVDVDYDIAFKWFKKSAANLNIDSINALGVCYENGQGVDVDLEKAAGYFETAMNNGHVLAARNIANYYFRGKHFDVDRNKAADIWESLALAGDILSAKDIGICYENGHGREKDLKQARAWYKIAADGGNEDAIKYLKELN